MYNSHSQVNVPVSNDSKGNFSDDSSTSEQVDQLMVSQSTNTKFFFIKVTLVICCFHSSASIASRLTKKRKFINDDEEDAEKVEMLVGVDRTDRSKYKSIGRFFLTLYKQPCGSLSML